jgi:hypothetical protein
VVESLSPILGGRLTGLIIREERPSPDPKLVGRAEASLKRILELLNAPVEPIDIFARDNAVVGGRMAAELAARIPLNDVDDIVVDFSALSIGVSFPLTKVLMERAQVEGCSLHAVVVSAAELDAAIRPVPADVASAVHGFQDGWRLDATEDAARLWLPQLAHGQRNLLDRIFREVQPHDTCPILPFPSENPRRSDVLIEEYLEELESEWEVDGRNIIYAAESDPLDVYRTVLELDTARSEVFDGHGGSLCVLSPVGSKVLALGALMAAIDRDFPIVYVEAIGYEINAAILNAFPENGGEIAHVWLASNNEGDDTVS